MGGHSVSRANACILAWGYPLISAPRALSRPATSGSSPTGLSQDSDPKSHREAASRHRPSDAEIALLGRPDPADLAGAIHPSEHHPASIIQTDYITACDFTADAGRITGRVSFQAPGAYRGEVPFTATRDANSWQIQSFHLPRLGWTVRRTEAGRWQARRLDNPQSPDRRPARSVEAASRLPHSREVDAKCGVRRQRRRFSSPTRDGCAPGTSRQAW